MASQAIRRGPEAGYGFGNKRQYRRTVWAEARRWCAENGIARRDAEVMLMPSIEGDEINVAEAAGFSRRRMHCVDRNAAIVAHLQRRFPGIQTYGVELDSALDRMRLRGVSLTIANLDLCGPVSLRSLPQTFEATHRVLADVSLAFVTVLRGRESGEALARVRLGHGVFDSDLDVALESAATCEAAGDRLSAQAWLKAAERDEAALLAFQNDPALKDYRGGDGGRDGLVLGAMLIARRTEGLARGRWSLETADLRPGAQEAIDLRRAETYRSTAGTQTMRWYCMGFNPAFRYNFEAYDSRLAEVAAN